MKIKKVLSGVMALLLCLVFVVACAPSEAGGTEITVTYNYNYEGAPAAAVETIEESDVAPIPENPVRDRYAFTGWYTDAACTEKFDFEEALYEDVTIYAGWELAEVLVTFDYNHDSTVEVKEAAVGGTISQPADPQWDGHLFTGWYTDAACTEKFDFATVIEQDTTIYAGWEEVSGDVVTITYMWNYDGAPNDGVCNVASVQKGRKTTAYAANRGEEFYLEGWYTDAACTEKFDFNERVNENYTLYARWYDIYKFEAEYTDFTGVTGSGYSGGGGGLDNIVRDTFNAGASNGFYVTNMYCFGSSLTFVINADKATEGETVLALRMSAEYFDMTIDDEMYSITVNGEAVEFDDIVFSNVPSYTSGQKRPFADYVLNRGISLKEGENIIKIVVNNSDRMQESGTLNATAPMVDCLYLYTDVGLSWTEKTINLDNK